MAEIERTRRTFRCGCLDRNGARRKDDRTRSSLAKRHADIYPTHPPFHITLNNRHGDLNRGCGYSSSNELIITSARTSTHIDALAHVSENGKLHGGVNAAAAQQGTELFKEHGVETIRPIFRRGVLLDIACARKVDVLKPAAEVTVADLETAAKNAAVAIHPGDVILLRTGWTRYWTDSNLSRPQLRWYARCGGERRGMAGRKKASCRRQRRRGDSNRSCRPTSPWTRTGS